VATDDYSRISVSVNDGQETWMRNFYDYSLAHTVPVLGLRPSRTNVITVTTFDRFGNQVTAPPASVVTARLPYNFPGITVLKSVPEKMEPGYTLYIVINRTDLSTWVSIVDNAARPIWYTRVSTLSEVKQLENGDLFFISETNFVEMNLLGDMVNTWETSTNLGLDIHEALPTDHGTILYLGNASLMISNFPSSSTDPSAPTRTTNVAYQPVIEISAANGAVLDNWSPLGIVDPRRIDYLTFSFSNPLGVDWEHANAIIEDPRDDSIVVSMRHQDALVKFSRATGKLKWILGPHENWGKEFEPYLFQPAGTNFEWSFGQHGPMLTPQGTILVYDDGNYRASPFDQSVANSNNYSRAVEYKLDEKTMTISQVWEYGRTNGDQLFTDRVGNADWLPHSGNVLITFGYMLYENGRLPNPNAPYATGLRIKEVTHDANPEVVFDFACFDYATTSQGYFGTLGYRSHRIPDLYPVVSAARQVADLMPAVVSSGARRSQTLVASLGSALQSIGTGNLPVAMRRLSTFQLLVKSAKLQPNVAMPFICQAQGIIDAMRTGASTYASERFTGVFPTFSSYHALADLVTEVGETNLRSRTQLVTSLSAALTNLGRNNPTAAVRGLRSFQALVRGSKADPASASRFQFEAQRVIDALSQGH
jgi:hypothetical protein